MKISVILFLLINISLEAQTDYLKLPLWDSMLSCGNHDTTLTRRLISNLKAINPDTLANRHVYYKDLGMCYYDLFYNSNDTSYLTEAIKALTTSVTIDSTYYISYWNMAVSYFFLKNCKKCQFYIDKYAALAPRKQLKKDKRQIEGMRKRCQN